MRQLRLGFSGTRKGLMPRQRAALVWWVDVLVHDLNPDEVVATHGGCVGADAEFHEIAMAILAPKVRIVVRPSNLVQYQAVLAESTGDRPVTIVFNTPASPLVRNAEIVDTSDYMVTCPAQDTPQRGGTWSTTRLALEALHRGEVHKVAVIGPGGHFLF